MPFAQRLNALYRNLKGQLWRKLFEEVVESSQPSSGQKWSKLEPGRLIVIFCDLLFRDKWNFILSDPRI
jgi:hypothetical protein